MALYRRPLLLLTSQFFRGAPQINLQGPRGMKRWVAPTLHELYRRRQKIGPEPEQPRSTYLEWSYEAEIFAFGKRLSEEFDRNLLKQALTNRSYIIQQELKAKNEETAQIAASNQDQIKAGYDLITNYITKEYQCQYPKDVTLAIVNYLTTDEMLARIANQIGLKDIILTAEFPVEQASLAATFKAIVAALAQSQSVERSQLFIRDFVCSQLQGKDIFDIWVPDRPLDYLQNLLEERGINKGIEPRLCRQSAVNTILANYQVGLFGGNKELLGIGWGESIATAKDTAALDAIQRIAGFPREGLK